MSREYLVNVDFDLSLRPGWRGPASVREQHMIEDFAAHSFLVGGPEDSVLLHQRLPAAYCDYLKACGVTPPCQTVLPELRTRASFTPFGWNEHAAELNRSYDAPSDHPPLEVVRRVNNRIFGAELASTVGEQEHDFGVFNREEELLDHLASQPARADGWVLKAGHGNAAMGNRRLRTVDLAPSDLRWLQARLAEGVQLHLEPWIHRLHDLCTTFTVQRSGEVVDLHFHEVVNTADGAFLGVCFDRRSPVIARWRERLGQVALVVAARLAEVGYFGPVCLDSIVFDAGGEPRLRSVVDINARLHVSVPILHLWRGLGDETAAYWRFFTCRKLQLPASYDALLKTVGEDAFDPDRGRGAMLTSPLWLGEEQQRRRPHKLGVLFAGRSLAEAMAVEARFSRCFISAR